MKSYISLLRGINVSGQKKILMADLRTLYTALGFKKIQTYIQSGNVAFEYKESDPKELQQLIFDKIKTHYNFEVPNLILTLEEIQDALNNNPYSSEEKPYITFLSAAPLQENIAELNKYKFENEYYQLNEKVIYSHFPNGAGRAKLNNNFFEKKLQVSATTRNLRTTQKLLEMTELRPQ